ncbi:hypothetical protein [Acanthamoeba castellanii mimivirus]|uniref:Uncharacterized protein L899 n=6 Tax=Megamimivirinae TaxID=3044648 RepID=YL899_MIMIV|nr:hypothetical protein MIMI_gp0963 [Acanthamoeba polyphaga mimivirus]Q5UQZ3.1 RecName: Full=Uncharacterized protein L899 [Acanthamoeba polyphaga mimivirus]AEQ61118.1 hypothetical protein [Acanthamoeba castellanii mamavirus]AHA44923.1 hypothetical protein HIRU_S17 [Hirudovirus strain Sangsue]AHJ40452.1 hypothetical protein [Samba virus]ALR84535.1 hypothetical protein [Niemeyer virus]AMZ03335.1 hypothetical protein [Mimivirus Bombay]AUV59036.1 hypothetical protein [Bandra megavirus]EJN40514.
MNSKISVSNLDSNVIDIITRILKSQSNTDVDNATDIIIGAISKNILTLQDDRDLSSIKQIFQSINDSECAFIGRQIDNEIVFTVQDIAMYLARDTFNPLNNDVNTFIKYSWSSYSNKQGTNEKRDTINIVIKNQNVETYTYTKIDLPYLLVHVARYLSIFN